MQRNVVELTGTGADFDGQLVASAFNLNRCGPKKHPPMAECFTIFGKGRRVLAYVDSVLLEDATFVVSKAGVARIRKKKAREVIAWVEGTARDPEKVKKRLGDMREWVPVTFCPYTDDEFMMPEGPQERCGPGARRPGTPIAQAKWVYFDSASKKAIALPHGYTKNPAAVNRLRGEGELSALAEMVGGDVTSMGG